MTSQGDLAICAQKESGQLPHESQLSGSELMLSTTAAAFCSGIRPAFEGPKNRSDKETGDVLRDLAYLRIANMCSESFKDLKRQLGTLN